MTTTTATTTTATARQPRTLVAARVLAGVVGAVQLTGAFVFLVLARDAVVWLGPWIDVPVVALTLTGTALKLGLALAPRLSVERRIGVGLAAVAVGVVLTLVKVPAYEEPEGVLFLAVDAVLLALLLLARRPRRR